MQTLGVFQHGTVVHATGWFMLQGGSCYRVVHASGWFMPQGFELRVVSAVMLLNVQSYSRQGDVGHAKAINSGGGLVGVGCPVQALPLNGICLRCLIVQCTVTVLDCTGTRTAPVGPGPGLCVLEICCGLYGIAWQARRPAQACVQHKQ
jgi:hypothetical protein